ncbi:hypothetical protein L5515_002400 [Caenorhabditis briggsae]|uniref:Uncharacterized protein n=1 Tax=Caenorhabditis briggsae TaxID=6238 RepID=A0AAE9E8M8_CAEBR|nr:hypothetical protein L5515_002400 [Caenorhabditis briggsae]
MCTRKRQAEEETEDLEVENQSGSPCSSSLTASQILLNEKLDQIMAQVNFHHQEAHAMVREVQQELEELSIKRENFYKRLERICENLEKQLLEEAEWEGGAGENEEEEEEGEEDVEEEAMPPIERQRG